MLANRWTRVGSCVLASLLSQFAFAQATRYVLTDLGAGAAFGVNNYGAVVGTRDGQAVRWFGRNSVVLWGEPGQGNVARHINDVGQVVGSSLEDARCKELPCFPLLTIFENGGVVDIEERFGTLPPVTFAADINDAGQIATNWFLFDLPSSTFRPYTEGTDIAFVGNAINNEGVVAGRWIGFSWEVQMAATWTGGEISVIDYPTARTSDAFDVSDAGHVVGLAFDDPGLAHPFLFHNGVATDIQPRCIDNFADPRAVNAGGVIVGTACSVALVWHDARAFALDQLVAGGTHLFLLEAWDISDAGFVVGSAVTPDGDPRAFLLTPIECLADWDGSTTLNSADFFEFLGDFFEGSADIDFSGGTDSADFFAYVTAFFMGC